MMDLLQGLIQFMPFGRPKGLALKHGSVEAVQASRDKLSVSVRVAVSAADDEPYQAAIEQALQAAQFKKGKIAVSIPSQDVLLRFFSLPLLPHSEWQAAIKFEARKHIPFRTEELIWDYHAVEERGRKQIAVVFVGVRKDRFERTRRLLREAGVDASIIEPQNISFSRAVAQAYPKAKQEFICAVELEDDGSTAHIGIVRGGLPHLARDVALRPRAAAVSLGGGLAAHESAGASLSEPVDLGLPAPEAPTGEEGESSVWVASTDEIVAPPPVEAPPPAAVEPVTEAPEAEADRRQERLLSELRLSLDFFTREYPSASVTRLVIYGDVETISPWCIFLNEHLHVPVEPGLIPLSMGEGVFRPSASAIGLAMQGGASSGPRIDFLARSVQGKVTSSIEAQKDELIEKGISFIHQALPYLRDVWKPLILQTLVAAVFVGAAAFYSLRQTARAESELARMKAAPKIVVPGGVGEDKEALAELGDRLTGRLVMVRRVLEQRVSVTEKWESLAKNLPEGFWFQGIEYVNRIDARLFEKAEMRLKGACYLPGPGDNELERIGAFGEQMRHDPGFFRGFHRTQVEGISTAEDQRTQLSYRTFTLNCESEKPL